MKRGILMTTYQATHVTARTAPKKKLLARYRRLLVILSALVIILLSLLIAQGIHYSARAEELNVKTYQSVTISEGECLWTIAQQYKAEGMDVRRYVGEIKRINQLSSDTIVSGQSLILPIYSVSNE
jgi:hypothetical protein